MNGQRESTVSRDRAEGEWCARCSQRIWYSTGVMFTTFTSFVRLSLIWISIDYSGAWLQTDWWRRWMEKSRDSSPVHERTEEMSQRSIPQLVRGFGQTLRYSMSQEEKHQADYDQYDSKMNDGWNAFGCLSFRAPVMANVSLRQLFKRHPINPAPHNGEKALWTLRSQIFTLKPRIQPMKRSTTRTKHTLLRAAISSL